MTITRYINFSPYSGSFNKKLAESENSETYCAVDEMVIPFKGYHSLKVYMSKKSTKRNYKMWCRPGVPGYVYEWVVNCEIPAGYEVYYQPKETEYVVLRLY